MLKDLAGSTAPWYLPLASAVTGPLPRVTVAPATPDFVLRSTICPFWVVPPGPVSPPLPSGPFCPSRVVPASPIGGGGLTSPAPQAAKRNAKGDANKVLRTTLWSMGQAF